MQTKKYWQLKKHLNKSPVSCYMLGDSLNCCLHSDAIVWNYVKV